MNPDNIFPDRENAKVNVHSQFLGTSNDGCQENAYHHHTHLTKRAKHNYTQTL